MNVALQTGSRPPYAEFFETQVEDREASLQAGHYVGKPVHMVRLRQVGSRDHVDKVAEDWLKTIHQNPNMMPEWVIRFRAAYDQFKQGLEPVVDGTHIKMWPAVSPAQAATIIGAGIRSVEDLAAANESALARIGIGARELQRKALTWLETARTTGKAAAEIDSLRVHNSQLESSMDELRVELAKLRAQVGVQGAQPVGEDEDFLGKPKKNK
jgi:hypothetical protein